MNAFLLELVEAVQNLCVEEVAWFSISNASTPEPF
jgi:hypothetical protein